MPAPVVAWQSWLATGGMHGDSTSTGRQMNETSGGQRASHLSYLPALCSCLTNPVYHSWFIMITRESSMARKKEWRWNASTSTIFWRVHNLLASLSHQIFAKYCVHHGVSLVWISLEALDVVHGKTDFYVWGLALLVHEPLRHIWTLGIHTYACYDNDVLDMQPFDDGRVHKRTMAPLVCSLTSILMPLMNARGGFHCPVAWCHIILPPVCCEGICMVP